jgi:cyanophycinase
MKMSIKWCLIACAALLCGCRSATLQTAADGALPRGTLLLIGGGLDDDNRPVYERFLTLAAANGPARIVIATAATSSQDQEAIDKSEALRTWAPQVQVQVVRRETPTGETVAAIDLATAMFFTGGDQQRIIDRYRPHDTASPEWLAMRRLLARGGVIAGTSAGDAMMGEVMFLGGGSTTALGIVPRQPRVNPGEEEDEESPAQLGPRIGPGMRFLPDALADSHFFERYRIGRLVAALEASGRKLGIGVGEDAAVEVDLASGEIRGISVAETLLIDSVHLKRDGLARTGLVARIIGQGDRLRYAEWLARPAPPALAPAGPLRTMPVVEPGQNRQLAAWRLFRQASVIGNPGVRQDLDGYAIIAFPAGGGDVAFEIRATP